MNASSFFNFPENHPFSDFFSMDCPPWEWLPLIKKALAQFPYAEKQKHTEIPPGVFTGDHVFIHPSVKLPPYAVIEGPAYIGAHTIIRPNAYIRNNVIIGEHCLIGNSCEYKNCLLLNHVQTPHYNYVGDSIIGNYSHLGAGVILANLRLDKKNIILRTAEGRVPTELRKIGAILGDHAEAGCNAMLQPGTLLGQRSIIGPSVAFRGYLEADHIALGSSDYKISKRTH